ncbi:hypothetical protein JZ00_27810 [Pseudomonas frederiksbergensis]|uniref:Uncharacterized protein n=1 Tax=Pseudomonas frederiksbergensis TaxID=104087 RepID=A0A0B1YWI2_9PSED|nr:hypothetical protein JZ00_27810 [Pseudomonas frederiksbergensis]
MWPNLLAGKLILKQLACMVSGGQHYFSLHSLGRMSERMWRYVGNLGLAKDALDLVMPCYQYDHMMRSHCHSSLI